MANEEVRNGEGLNKAALLMMTLERPILAEVLKHLSPDDLTRLMQVYERQVARNSPPEDQLATVGKEFLESRAPGASGHFREALVIALGPESAEQITRQDYWGTISGRVKPEALAGLLRGERPEAVSIVLSQLPPRYGAEVLSHLPKELREEAVERLARSESVPSSALDAILRAIEENFKGSAGLEEGEPYAGVKRAAALLNQLDSETAKVIVDRIRASDATRASAIEQEMFHFEDFLKLENRTLQRVLTEVKAERLALALKGTTDAERELIFAALPDQVKQAVKQEIEDSGKVPAREVRAARGEITSLAVQMDRDGKIRLKVDPDLVG